MGLVEKWVPVHGTEGMYRVSDAGGVQGPKKRLTPWVHQDGHLRVTIRREGRRMEAAVHRLVLEAFVGPCPPGMEALHRNGDPTDNRLENLRWGTRSENNLDRQRHGVDHYRNRAHCPRGHLLQEPNLVVAKWQKRGHRQCLACNRALAYLRKQPQLMQEVQQISDRYYRDIMRQ